MTQATFDVEAASAHLAAADKKLARLIKRVGPFRLQLRDTHSTFGALAEAIVYQQLTGKAAATIYGRVKALYPRRRIDPEGVLATSDAQLRACGLSGNKLLALKDLAAKTQSGVVPTLRRLRTMADDDAIAFGGDVPAPRAVTARGERWRPYRTMASWYLWRAVDSLD